MFFFKASVFTNQIISKTFIFPGDAESEWLRQVTRKLQKSHMFFGPHEEKTMTFITCASDSSLTSSQLCHFELVLATS